MVADVHRYICSLFKLISSASHSYLSCSTGDRKNFASSDLSEVLPEEIEEDVKAAAEISMGTEVSEEDISNIQHLCDQVIM